MIGMVLAAGAGSRLGDETADLPKTLLGVDGDRTILDIAQSWGFTSAAHFSRAFRAHYGMSPSDARGGTVKRA